MDTENNTPEKEEVQEDVEKKTGSVPMPPNGTDLPLIRTLHRDAEAAKGGAQTDDFKPTRPGGDSSQPEQKEEVVEDEGVPEQVSGFVPPTQLHRVQETHARPERKAPEEEQKKPEAPEPPTSALKKEPKKTIVRTYEDDSARALRENKGSVASIAVAEQKRRQAQPAPKPTSPWKKYLVKTLTLLLILAGVGALGYAAWQTRPPGTVEPLPDQSLIFADQVRHEVISPESTTELRDVIASFMSEEAPLDAIRELRIISLTQTEEGTVENPLTPERFLEGVGLERRAPLARALGQRIMIAAAGTPESEAILIADVTSYDSAFASMIRWEPTIVEDLDFFLPDNAPVATSTATTTAAVNTDEFVDVIISNRDARVLYDETGKIRLLYSFPTINTLVITTDDDVYRDVLERLGRRAFSR